MDQSAILQLVSLFILIVLSAYFSSAETALSTVNQISLKSLADEGDARAALTLKVLDDYGKMLSTILIMNNIVNLSASAISTSFFITNFGANAVTIATAVLTAVIILFGEITPKNISKIRSQKIAMRDAPVINALMILLTPVIAVIDFLAGILLKIAGVSRDEKTPITENELRTYVEVGHEDGVIEGREKKFIYNVFDFGDSVAKDIMVPRIDMVCAPDDATYDDIMDIFAKDMFTRIPVYHEDPDNIIGHINIKDFIVLKDKEDFSISSIIHESYFTYEYKKTADLLKEMQQRSSGVAFVLNEYGATVGMITLEDLVEEIVGEIRDEYDDDEKELIHKYDALTFLVDGSMKLDDINDALGSHFDSEDYDSIGGLIIEKLERLPRNEESVTLDDGNKLQTKGIRRNRIVKVLIRFAKEPGAAETAAVFASEPGAEETAKTEA